MYWRVHRRRFWLELVIKRNRHTNSNLSNFNLLGNHSADNHSRRFSLGDEDQFVGRLASNTNTTAKLTQQSLLGDELSEKESQFQKYSEYALVRVPDSEEVNCLDAQIRESISKGCASR